MDDYLPAVFSMDREEVVKRLNRLKDALYSERRMNGDKMRDFAQDLTAILDTLQDRDVIDSILFGQEKL